MDTERNGRIIIAGTGPVGLTAALALADIGMPVTLAGPPPSSDDRRTTALMTPALAFLDGLGVLAVIGPRAAPLKVMRIADATKRLIRGPVVIFRAAEIGEDHFGLNIPNRDLNAALESAVAAHPAIEWRRVLVESWTIGGGGVLARLADGSTVEGALAVAADGRLSPARAAAGIRVTTRSYPQAALVLNFSHSRGHGFVSTEFHTETGPFTQVPLPGDRSSLVWVVNPKTAEELAALDDASLSERVEEQMQSILGRVAVEPGRQVYPLGATLPVRFAQNRVALVGEAAHVFPPIGAQGLNLGIRDVRDLVQIVTENRNDPGTERALSAYDRRRRPDVLARAGAVNLLNLSLLSDMLPVQLARSAGLGMVGGFAPLRALFMREGLQPGSGFASMLSGLREQVRR
ncbi:UbiH/UbiF family hydroxylase [Mesorhizobium sp. KR9-304]|uniref:UbiH/UbiF family hydroxylase n=1 Tax=Mesorhizobium sp. KR9-304 TaxID=3156614 RepID=UPI0032B3BF23